MEDEEGKFLTVPAIEEETRVESPGLEHLGHEEEQPTHVLKRELDALTEENHALKAEVSDLKHKLHEEKNRFRDLWRTNCQCLADYDEVIASKIVKLRS